MDIGFLVSFAVIAFAIEPCWSVNSDLPDFIPLNYSYSLSNNNKELVEGAGYNYELYNVTTKDGYIVALHRISNPNSITHGHPVLLFNGVGVSSRCWIVRGKKADLPFLLVDAGYDVWLADQRGNPYSRKHVKYTIFDAAYWNFTFHETGVFDLPAMIDFILEKTSQPKLSFVGQSLGSSFFFSLTSETDNYDEKIASSVHLNPLISPPKLRDMNPFVTASIQLLSKAMSIVKGRILEPDADWFFDYSQWFVRSLCDPSPFQFFCIDVARLIFGRHNIKNIDKEHLGYQIASSFGRTSFKTLRHVVQVFSKGCLCKYDYGAAKNSKIYGTATPPAYNITRLSSPTAIFYGTTDNLVTSSALQKAINNMGKFVRPYLIPDYTHFDLAFGRSAPKQAYKKIINFFDEIVSNELEKTKSS